MALKPRLSGVLDAVRPLTLTTAGLTIDSAVSSNIVDVTATGDGTLNLSAGTNGQRTTVHVLASGATRTVTLGAAVLEPPGVPSVYGIAAGTVLVFEFEWLGLRPTPMWLVRDVRYADAPASAPFGVVARHRRPSASGNSTGTTATTAATAQQVARLAAPVLAGRVYRVKVNGHYISTATATLGVQITYTTDGSTPTVSSASLGPEYVTCSVAGQTETRPLDFLYYPTTNHTLTALLSFWRQSGSGTCTMQNSATLPLDVVVEDVGPDPGSSGTALT